MVWKDNNYEKNDCFVETYIIMPLYKKLGGKYKPKRSHLIAGAVNGLIQEQMAMLFASVSLIPICFFLGWPVLLSILFYETLFSAIYVPGFTRKSWNIYKMNKPRYDAEKKETLENFVSALKVEREPITSEGLYELLRNT